jgi:hypothetical protein
MEPKEGKPYTLEHKEGKPYTVELPLSGMEKNKRNVLYPVLFVLSCSGIIFLNVAQSACEMSQIAQKSSCL